jgi:uncharacterized protein (TIGR03118 family)
MKSKLATLFAGLSLLLTPLAALAQNSFTQVDLVSDVSGRAPTTDANLVNPWGIAPGGSCTFWVSNNVTGTSTLYSPDGAPQSLVASIPGGLPTGVVAVPSTNTSLRFSYARNDTTVTARFIFVTQTGVIAAWNPTLSPNALQVASNDGAIYGGAAIASTGSGARLYAANFGECSIDVYDSSFVQVTPSGSFSDPNLPAGYCPWNVSNINGQLYVAYALKSGDDEVKGAGNGYIDVYDTNGNLLSRFASDAELNAPWAMVLAPSSFGDFSGDLLVGNFGDGRVLAYSLGDGSFQGALKDSLGNTIAIEGLWGLATCSAAGSTVANRLYFAAGTDDETHGLFGYIRVSGTAGGGGGGGGGGETCVNRSRGIGFWAQACATNGNGNGHGHGNGHGNNGDNGDNGKGKGKGNDKNSEANGMGWANAFAYGHDKDHGRGHGVTSDSLDAMFSCISDQGGAFGSGGCLTAGCDLLAAKGHRSTSDKVGQQFLVLMLNRCAGFICDSDSISTSCIGDAEDEDGDDDEGGSSDTLDVSGVHTVGDLIALANDVLCSGSATSGQLEELKGLIECATEGGEDEDGDDLRTQLVQRSNVPHGGLIVKTLSGNPIRPSAGVAETRIQLSSDRPVMVQLGIYDTQGRLVAHLLRNVAVAGTTEVRWDGRDFQGGRVPSGTYFYRATAGRSVATGRIVVLK